MISKRVVYYWHTLISAGKAIRGRGDEAVMTNKIGNVLHGGPVDGNEVKRVRDTLLFEGAVLKKKLVRFFCLLILAASIATFGILGDSLASIIGAMIVAPLMLPIMGLAFSVSIGDRRAVLSSLLVSLGGIITAIAVGYILTIPMASLFHPEGIEQIMNRTAPRLMDLLAALVTGLAGAFALSRKDVSDTLPGVAIAISLVPPLANVGILLALGRPDLATGSLLLFVTNYFAILLTGSLVFGLIGFSEAALTKRSVSSKRKAIVIALLALILIAVPLTYTSYNVVKNNVVTVRVYEASDLWLAESGYRLISVNTETADNAIYIVLLGEGELPPLSVLKDKLDGKTFGKTVKVETVQSALKYLHLEEE
jgi:uncharacterized hydrophobic protein (TIGR00271 family)